MYKKVILASLVIAHLILILVISGMFFLAEVYPFQPGDALYPLQHAGEQVRLAVTSGRASRAEYALALTERRLADMAQAATPAAVEASVESFETALQSAAGALDDAPQGAHETLYARLEIILGQADVVVHTLGDRVDLALLQELHSRLVLSQEAPNRNELQAVILSEIPAEAVPFYAQDVDHSKFGLFGGHYSIDCMSCHQDGHYAGTANTCSSCHQPKVYQQYMPELYGNRMIAFQSEESLVKPAQLYPEHYAGECSDCHSIYTWEPVAFDHRSVYECVSCHNQDLPVAQVVNDVLVEHYPGDCKECHSSYTDWQMTDYGHEGVQACESCHTQVTPQDHYEGVCSNCHVDIQDWQSVVFDHGRRQECSSCHSVDSPVDHYGGQCSNCHSTESWAYGVFDHPSGSNCSTCHVKPADHYKENCSSCHNPNSGNWEKTKHTDNQNCMQCHDSPVGHYEAMACTTCHASTLWTVSKFDHTVANIACTDCHAALIPAKHYQSECEDCHNTTDWSGWVFNHTNYTACAECHLPTTSHYPGVCSDCHSTNDWVVLSVDHTQLVDCLTCHQTPTDHYLGLCSDCHSTDDWYFIEVDHTYMYDCLSCHNTPQDHWPGQCSSCHVVDDWSEIYFDHVTYTDCNACHMRPAGHPRGMCSNCHTTDSWVIPTNTPIPTPTPGGELAAEDDVLPAPVEDYGLPPEYVPYLTPKPTSTPVESDYRPTPTEAPSEAPRDSEITPTPEPSDDPEVQTTPLPLPEEPEPLPGPTPEAAADEAGGSSELPDSQVEVSAQAAILPKDHVLVIEPENQLDQEEDELEGSAVE